MALEGGLFGNRVLVYDDDALNIITTIRLVDGVELSLNERVYVNYIVTNFKKIGVWSKIKALYGFVGGTAATHKWNWKDMRDLDGAFRLTFPNGMTHSANGITANSASSQFARTFLNNNVLSINSNHLSIYAFNVTSGIVLSGYRSNNNSRVSLNTTSFSSNTQTTTSLSKSLIGKSGFSIINRTTSTLSYLLNKDVKTGEQNISTTINDNLVEYKLFNRGVASGQGDINNNDIGLYTSGTIGFASIGDGFTDTEAIQTSQIVTFAQRILNRA